MADDAGDSPCYMVLYNNRADGRINLNGDDIPQIFAKPEGAAAYASAEADDGFASFIFECRLVAAVKAR